jgi:uncharacterized protein YutE (UPF0331/DUF86 family)
MNEVALNKKISIERCLQQIQKYYAQETGVPFEMDFLKQDAIALNIQRVCELSIDLANHTIKKKKLGLPKDSRDSFALLYKAGLINVDLRTTLQSMVGFRNILVHAYQDLDIKIMVDIIERRMSELPAFANTIIDVLDKSS